MQDNGYKNRYLDNLEKRLRDLEKQSHTHDKQDDNVNRKLLGLMSLLVVVILALVFFIAPSVGVSDLTEAL